MSSAINLEITGNYERLVRVFSVLEKRLKVHIRLHGEKDRIADGQIFLFNHFARFETVIPQYLIFKETGEYCRSVAASEFFAGDDGFSRFLLSMGAVPNDHDRLLPFLAAEILRGRKVVVFPEGGMIKDRKVLDAKGRYRVFSPTAKRRRKHHRGASVIALTLEAFKKRIVEVHAAGDWARLDRWVNALGLADAEVLLAAVRKPTLIVPANITFYPIRITDNLLRKGVDLFAKGLGSRFTEELLIEGNILLKDTDMDIRLGEPVTPGIKWHWWERLLLAQVFRRIHALDDLFSLDREAPDWDERLFARYMHRQTDRLRDETMRRMYEGVTVNLSHLASCMILGFIDSGRTEVPAAEFHRTLYLAVKNAQSDPAIFLHRGLWNPERYAGTLEGSAPNLTRFLDLAEVTELIERKEGRYAFLPKLCEEHDFHEIRLENPVLVYANEMAPVAAARAAVGEALAAGSDVEAAEIAHLRFDDERRALACDKEIFTAPRFAEINDQETARESAEPYLILPDNRNELGVVMVHGFLASPAEMRELGEKTAAAGYPVMGVRLKGHGTSPWDLRERDWEDWLASLRRGLEILGPFVKRICLVGFSTGAALALLLAAERPPGLAGVAAIATPLKFQNKNLIFVPLLRGINQLTRLISPAQGVKLFQQNNSEHPHINYFNMPIRALYELTRMVDALEEKLPDVACPVALVQGTEDNVVDPQSAELILEKLGCVEKSLHWVFSDRHGIVTEDIGDTHAHVLAFIAELAAREALDSG